MTMVRVGITGVMVWIGSGFGMASERDGLHRLLSLPSLRLALLA